MSDPFSSALHPEIPLGVKVPQAAGASSALNSVGVLSEVQNRLNQARLFQQTFAAQQRFGQIMSAAGSVPEGLNAASQDPSVLGFFPEGLARLQQFEQSRVATAGEQQKQVNTALEAAGRMSAMGYQDPGMLPRIYQLTRDMLPKGAANAQASQALDDYYMAITDHAPGLTPDAVKSKIQANIGGAMTAAGMSPDMQAGVVPRTEMAPLGGTLQPILRAPGSAGGAATPVGQGLPMTLPPQMAEAPGGGRVQVGGSAGGGLPLPVPQSPQASAGASAGAPAIPLAGDGTPLYDPQSISKVPLQPVAGGFAPQNKALADQNDHLQAEFASNGQRDLTAARLTQGSITEMKSGFNTLMQGAIDPKTGKPQANFLTMGAGAEARSNLAGLLNTAAGVLGTPSWIDVGKTATMEDLRKATNRLGVQYTTSALPGQREAAMTISRLTSGAQPSANNTYAGGMLVANMVNAGATRQADWRQYQSAVMNANNGFMSNKALTDFDSLHPYSQYINQAFEHFGGDMGNAVRQKYMTRGDAAEAMRVVANARAEAQREGQ